MQRITRPVVVLLMVAALLVAMAAAAWAPKRYVEPSNGRPAQVSLPHPPPIRGGG